MCVGKHRIDRCEMTKKKYNNAGIGYIMFYRKHSYETRTRVETISLSMVYNIKQIVDLVSFINDMFKKRLTENENK